MGRSWQSARSPCDGFVSAKYFIVDFIEIFPSSKNRRETNYRDVTRLSSSFHGFSTCLSTGNVEKKKKSLWGLALGYRTYVFDIFINVSYTGFCFASMSQSLHFQDGQATQASEILCVPFTSSAPLCPRLPSTWGFFCPAVLRRQRPSLLIRGAQAKVTRIS